MDQMEELNSYDFENSGYELDEQAAAESDRGRIDTSGAYICTIIGAHQVISEKGTQGISIRAGNKEDGETEFTLWTKKDGKTIFGFNQLQAIMLLTGIKSLRGAKGKVTVYDAEVQERVEKDGIVYPDLEGKKIGLVMQKELYTGKTKISFRMNLAGAFHWESHLTASELKEKKVKPEKLAKLLARLKDKDSRKKDTIESPATEPMVGGF